MRCWTLKVPPGNSLAVQWLGLRASTTRGTGSILGGETKIPRAVQSGKKKKSKEIKSYLAWLVDMLPVKFSNSF